MRMERGGWVSSATAWIESQGPEGDSSRREILDPALEHLIVKVEGKSVLDIGCGEGRYARKLANLGAFITGIDPVPAFVRYAKQLHPEGHYLE